MTPELKNACEIVFQHHKASADPIHWNKELFRGQISIGLREMAKETLLKNDVIYFLNPAKKISTMINPAAVMAATYEEAIIMVRNKVPTLVHATIEEQPTYKVKDIPKIQETPAKPVHKLVRIINEPEVKAVEARWYLKPLFYYAIWPACALALSVLVAYLIGSISG